MFINALIVLFFFFQLAVSAPVSQTKLADGTRFKYIALASPLKQLQVTGVATLGCSESSIKSCTTLSLGSDPHKELDTHFPSSPRQRIEFRSQSYKSGETYTFTWKQFLPAGTGTSNNFFHLMQIFDESANFPVIVLNAKNSKLSIGDFERSNCGSSCPSVPLSKYEGKTTQHSLTVTFGGNGKMSYEVTDHATGDMILSHSASGKMGGASSYIKFGLYRQAFNGMKAITAAAGDFTATKH